MDQGAARHRVYWIKVPFRPPGLPAPPPGGNGGDLGFHDIVDLVDCTFLIHAEGQGDQFCMLADFTFVGLADEKEFARFNSESDIDARLFELEPIDPAFSTTTIEGGESFTDFMIGARYTFNGSERFGVTLRGDGSAGETDGTWNVSVMSSYKMEHGAWLFGYRYFTVDLADDNQNVQLTMQGPIVRYAFRF